MARKAVDQVYHVIHVLLLKHISPEKADELAKMLSQGCWPHDYPVDFDQAKEMGLPVNDQMSKEVYDLMELYPHARQQRPGVELIPTPYRSVPTAPGKGTGIREVNLTWKRPANLCYLLVASFS